MTIDVEDHTQPITHEELVDQFELFSNENKKALMALSNNDQIIIAQTKEALEEVTSKVLFLSKKLDLFADLIEEVLVKKIETEDRTVVVKMTLEEYKAIVESIK